MNDLMPDWVFTVLAITGAVALAIYIVLTVSEIKANRRKKIRKRLAAGIIEAKRSKMLAESYSAVAYGDKANFSYWYDTARKFM